MTFHQNVQAALGTESEEYSCLMNALDAFDSQQQGLEATMEILFGCVERHPVLLPQFRLMEQLGAAWREGNDDRPHQREEARGDEDQRPDPEVQREGNDVKYPSCHTPFARKHPPPAPRLALYRGHHRIS